MNTNEAIAQVPELQGFSDSPIVTYPTQSKARKIKVGLVCIRRRGKSYEFDFCDPRMGKRRRILSPTSSLGEAKEVALQISRQILCGKGLLRRDGELTIEEAFEKAIAISRAQQSTKATYRRIAMSFRRWLATYHRNVQKWSAVTTEMMQAYVTHLQERDYRNASIQFSVFIMRWTSRWMERSYPDNCRDVGRDIFWRPKRVNPFEIQKVEEAKNLSFDNLAFLLDHIQSGRPDLYPVACLQGLAGLRVLEAVSVRPEDVDLEHGTVTVTDTSHHTVKNRTSYRRIPVASTVIEALRNPMSEKHPDGYLFRNTERLWTAVSYYVVMNRLIKEVREFRPGRFEGFKPHYLRAVFSNLVLSRGVDRQIVKVYFGHSPMDTLAAWYQVTGLEQLRPVVAAIEAVVAGFRHKDGGAGEPSVVGDAGNAAVGLEANEL